MAVPNPPWKKGFHKDYTHFVIEVHVAKDHNNQVFSLHKLQHEEDEATVQRLPNQGLEECVFALLIETLRRESLLQTLVLMSQDPSVQQKLLNASKEEDLEALAERIAESTRDVMAKAVEKQSLASAKATLASLRHDLVQATGQQ